jgi:polyhydroxyalkanoate synthesis regulator phasin
MKKNNHSVRNLATMGASAIALAVSTYYFFGPLGKIHRKRASGWMIKIKGEIIEKIEEAGEITEEAYHDIVDSVLASYVATGKIAKPELLTFTNNLKNQWKHIAKTFPNNAKKVMEPVKKAGTKAKSAVKKVLTNK